LSQDWLWGVVLHLGKFYYPPAQLSSVSLPNGSHLQGYQTPSLVSCGQQDIGPDSAIRERVNSSALGVCPPRNAARLPPAFARVLAAPGTGSETGLGSVPPRLLRRAAIHAADGRCTGHIVRTMRSVLKRQPRVRMARLIRATHVGRRCSSWL